MCRASRARRDFILSSSLAQAAPVTWNLKDAAAFADGSTATGQGGGDSVATVQFTTPPLGAPALIFDFHGGPPRGYIVQANDEIQAGSPSASWLA